MGGDVGVVMIVMVVVVAVVVVTDVDALCFVQMIEAAIGSIKFQLLPNRYLQVRGRQPGVSAIRFYLRSSLHFKIRGYWL